MTVTVALKWDDIQSSESFTDNGGKADLQYWAYSDDPDVDTENDVRIALKDNSPWMYFNLVRVSIAVVSLVEDSPTRKMWSTKVSYSNPKSSGQQPRPSDGQDATSDTVLEIRNGGGATIQAMQSLALIEETAALSMYKLSLHPEVEKNIGLKAPAANSGVTFDTVGIPVTIGTVEIVAHAWKSLATWNAGYATLLASYAAQNVVNSAPWKGYAASTLRLTGYQAHQQVGDPTTAGWEVTYTFEFSPIVPAGDIEVGGHNPFTIDKGGHDYIDYLFVPEVVDLGVGVVVTMSKIVRVAMHKIFNVIDFETGLGI